MREEIGISQMMDRFENYTLHMLVVNNLYYNHTM